LQQIGIPFEVAAPAVDETPHPGEAAFDYVERMAREKAVSVDMAVRADESSCLVLAADTVVVLDGEILGKPTSAEAGIAMIERLGGRTHEVLTAIAVTDGQRLETEVVRTLVGFVPMDRALAEAYWATGEGADKAGGYGIQGIGGILAQTITGSYSAVVGLPLPETERLLNRFGMDTWRCR
jgi:septum formation protein